MSRAHFLRHAAVFGLPFAVVLVVHSAGQAAVSAVALLVFAGAAYATQLAFWTRAPQTIAWWISLMAGLLHLVVVALTAFGIQAIIGGVADEALLLLLCASAAVLGVVAAAVVNKYAAAPPI